MRSHLLTQLPWGFLSEIMRIKPINLLPPSRIRMLRKQRLIKLATVSAAVFSILIIIQMMLLFLSYNYLQTKYYNLQNLQREFSAKLASRNIQAINTRTETLNKNVRFLETLNNTPSGVAAIQYVLGIKHSGVTINSIIYTTPSKKQKAKIILSGVAQTREALHTYQQALQTNRYIDSVDLPVNSYAKDSNITFTITVMGSFSS